MWLWEDLSPWIVKMLTPSIAALLSINVFPIIHGNKSKECYVVNQQKFPFEQKGYMTAGEQMELIWRRNCGVWKGDVQII